MTPCRCELALSCTGPPEGQAWCLARDAEEWRRWLTGRLSRCGPLVVYARTPDRQRGACPMKHNPKKRQSCADADRAADEQIEILRAEASRLADEVAMLRSMPVTTNPPWTGKVVVGGAFTVSPYGYAMTNPITPPHHRTA